MKDDELILGDVIYNPKTRALHHVDGRPAQLRFKSRDVLGVLAEMPGKVVSKETILNAVWSNVVVSDESLVQCIADIRRLIGGEAKTIVETVPREGYRLNPSQNVQDQLHPPRYGRLAAIAAAVLLAATWVLWPDGQSAPEQPSAVAETEGGPTPPGTEVTEAYLEVLKGRVSADRFSKDESLIAERHFRRAIELDPNYARAYAELGILFAVRFENDWTVLRDADKEKALYYAEKSVELDPDHWLAHYSLGRLQSIVASLEDAEKHLRHAMSLQPENEDVRAYYGIVRNFQGYADDAVAILKPAIASHPKPPYWYYLGLGNALFNAGELEPAAEALNKCLEIAKDSPYCLRYLIAVYGELGQTDKAKTASQSYQSMGFEPSIGSIVEPMIFHTAEDRARLESAFRLAGLPE